VPDFVERAIAGMMAVMAGRAVDLRDVPLDDTGIDDFRRAVRGDARDRPGDRELRRSPARSAGQMVPATSVSRSAGTAPDHRPLPPRRGVNGALPAFRPMAGHEAPNGARRRARHGQRVLFGLIRPAAPATRGAPLECPRCDGQLWCGRVLWARMRTPLTTCPAPADPSPNGVSVALQHEIWALPERIARRHPVVVDLFAGWWTPP
jgi:hypothetical protein